MDIDDVSTVPQYLAVLKQQKGNLKRAQGFKGQRATPKKSRNEVISQFMLRQMIKSRENSSGSMNIRSSFLPTAYPPSIVSLDELSKIMLSDLSLETHHRGRYLLVRTVTSIDFMTAVMAIVEDEDERVLMLQLYNQREEISQPPDLPKGSVLVVKEPYVKVMADGDYGIRVDHLSDLIFVPGFDERAPFSWRPRNLPDEDSPAFWKERGNEFFEQTLYRFAIQCYTKTLQYTPLPDLAIATRLNRALCYLKTHRFDAALLDLDVVLQKIELSEKALFRKAQALYYLRKYRESCETHKLLGEKYPENSLAQHEFQRASARLVEQDTGNYQFKKMILEAKKRRPPQLERGTYVGPVTVKATQSHGRGLFTTEAVKAGDLLLCEKALAYAFHDDENSSDLTLLMSPDTNKMTLGTHGELIESIVQKLHKNPSLLPKFIDLYHGAYDSFDVRVDDQVVVDTFLVQKTIELNCFGCPLLSRQSHIKSMSADDTARDESKKFHSAGIWCMASYINHSCLSNARRSFIGDMMIVRASRSLPPDTEVNFWYQSPIGSPEGKPTNLQNWNFRCDCAICEDIQGLSQSVLSTRKRLSAELERLFKSKNRKLAKIDDKLASLAETYPRPSSQVPHLGLWSGYLSLAAVSLTSHRPEKAIKSGLKALESLGFVIDGGNMSDTQLHVNDWGLMTDGVVGCWMILGRAYCEVAPGLEAQAEKYARISYKICVGEDETFDETYGKLSVRADGLLVTRK
ncbi:hypothetical protein N7513_001792 [Penicillium frequentans]|nr:hypothetical protein N7513_001792 [Penicillium glabrum]